MPGTCTSCVFSNDKFAKRSVEGERSVWRVGGEGGV